MSKYLISGYYGRSNIGDEAILTQIISELYKTDKEAKITSLSYNPENTKKTHNIMSYNIKKPFQIIREIMKTDFFIYGGGGHEFTNNLLSIYVIFTSIFAFLFNKKVIAYAIGIEKNPSKMLLPLVRYSYNHFFSLIMVRDSTSKSIMKSWGVNEEKINVTCDPVINYSLNESYKKSFDDSNMVIKKISTFSNGSQLVGINYNSKEKKINLKEQKMIIDTVIKNGYKVVLIPMCLYEGDIEIINILEKEYDSSQDIFFVKEILNLENLYKLMGFFEFTIGMRFHFLIFSAIANIPFVALSNSIKVITITESLEQLNIIGIETNEIQKQIEDYLASKNNYKMKITININKLKINENKNLELIKNI